MQMDDMILVSIDDHFIEPPDMWKNHVPAKWADQVPKVVRNKDTGVDEWVFQGNATSTPFGMAATVGWPSDQWGFNPGSYSELRPGCFDVHERVRDMNANGVLASMNFPTMAGWNARTFAEGENKELGLVMLRAYNDWVIDEWCAAYPGRFIPLCLVPMWDLELAVEEVHRMAKKGCRSISMLETPHVNGYPSFLSGYWDPMIQACSDDNIVLSLHIGAGFDVINRPPEAPVDHLMVLACQISAITAQDLLFGPTLRQFPDLKVALSEGGIGWIPFYFDRVDRHYANQAWLQHEDDFGGKKPSEVFREHILACYISDPVRPAAARPHRHRQHRLGVRLPPHRHDVARVAGVRLEGVPGRRRAATTRSTRSRWENACRFFDWDPFEHTPKDQATVGALRALATDVDVTRMPRDEWKKRNEAAGIGVF